MYGQQFRTTRKYMDVVYGTLLQLFINSGAQKPGTEITLLLLTLKNNSMPYTEWRYGAHEETLQHSTQMWIDLTHKKQPHLCSVYEAHLYSQQELKVLQLLLLSTGELRCLTALYQYKQWMAQFLEIRHLPQNTPEKTACVAYVDELLNCPERLLLDAMLVSVLGTTCLQRPNIIFTQNIVYFLHLLHSKLKVLVSALIFDSIRSAADDL